MVQNNRVWLRSLAGLDPVDVVIRRVDDRWCDPVELRADSLLGVPGLLEVVRRGRVAVLNPLGSGILESPALAGLLADMAPALLGEELALRGPESWWCGRPDGLSHVLAGFDRLLLLPSSRRPASGPCDRRCWPGRARHPARPGAGPTGRLGRPGDPRPVDDADGRRRRGPGAPAGGAADLRGGRRVRRRATGSASCPGGLTRVGRRPDSLVISSRGDGTSKDTWVASTEPALQQSPWLPSGRTGPGPVVVPELPAPCPVGWPPGCSPWAGAPSTPSWSSASSARSWPGSTSPSAPATTVAPSRSRSCCPRSARHPASTRRPSPTTRCRGPAAGGRGVGGRGRPAQRPYRPGPAVRRRHRRQPRLDPRGPGRGGLLGPGAAVVRHLAARGRHRGGARAVPAAAADAVRRGPAQPAAAAALAAGPVRGVRREHGAGLGVAVPRRRSAPRAGPVAGPAAPVGPGRQAGRGGRGPPRRVAAQDVREPHHLPPPVRVHPARVGRPRPAGLRRGQPPQRPVPARPAGRPPGRAAQALVGPTARQRGAAGPRGDHPAAPHRPRPPGRRRRRHRSPDRARRGLRHRRRPARRSARLAAGTYFAHERLSVLAGGQPESSGGGT